MPFHQTIITINYFESFQKKSVYYVFRRDSGINVLGYLYENNFNPFDPWINLMKYLDFDTESESSSLFIYLQTGTTYYLVVTTSQQNITGDFYIRATGHEILQFISIASKNSITILDMFAFSHHFH